MSESMFAQATDQTDSKYGDAISSESAYKKAEKTGLIVVLPKDNELFIDIDDTASFIAFKRVLPVFSEQIAKPLSYAVTESKSGGQKRHIRVQLDRDVSATERILFQLMLGSDRVRETLGFVRISVGDEHPTLFFETPGYDEVPVYEAVAP